MGSLVHVILLLSCMIIPHVSSEKFSDHKLGVYRSRVLEMFQHAYDGYMKYAYPYDELRPLSCDGVDTWGSFSLTLIDALDTLAIMGNYTEFRKVAAMIAENINFNININVSVFETNIRVVGGLLSAHLLSRKVQMPLEPGWPCSGPLLRLAEDVATRLLPAFDTKTGMPYGTVNLMNGVPLGETSITCTAGVGTFLIEFATLSRLTGNPVFEQVALRALRALWKARTPIGLVGNHIDVQLGIWTATDSGIGAGVDSYYEYLVKGAIMLQRPELMRMFKEYEKTISKYMKRDDWYFWVENSSGKVTMPVFQSLEAFWPGLLTLIGDLDNARKSLYNYHQVWREYGFTPEFYEVVHGRAHPKRDGYPLRPELVESLVYLYQATKDPHFLEIGVDILESIRHSAKTECGYATIKKVGDHTLEDRMESFFLAETTKYLYLLFTPDHFIHNNGSSADIIQTSSGECVIDTGAYVFNTEAHPVDVAAVHCCSVDKALEDQALRDFAKEFDVSKLLVDEHRDDFIKPLRVSENMGDADDIGDGEKPHCAESSTNEKQPSPPSAPASFPAQDPASFFTDLLSSEKAAEENAESDNAKVDDKKAVQEDKSDNVDAQIFSFLSSDGEGEEDDASSVAGEAEGSYRPNLSSAGSRDKALENEGEILDATKLESLSQNDHIPSDLNGEADDSMQDVAAGYTHSTKSDAAEIGDTDELQPELSQAVSTETSLDPPEEESSNDYDRDEEEFDDEIEEYIRSHTSADDDDSDPVAETRPAERPAELNSELVSTSLDADNGSQEAAQATTHASTMMGDSEVANSAKADGAKDDAELSELSKQGKENHVQDSPSDAIGSNNSDDPSTSGSITVNATAGWKAEVKEVMLAPGEEEEVIIRDANNSEARTSNDVAAHSLGLLQQALQEAFGKKSSVKADDSEHCVKKPAKELSGWLMLTCPSQPFTSRLAFRGEMFNIG
uniref:alpha-1,2-Mannosidase n=1 Tax=Rhipicephalus appendiculatus TaxID=34631 RepID=A0A131YLI7_RHIAP